MHDGLGVGLGGPALGDDQNLGFGRGGERHRCSVSLESRTSPIEEAAFDGQFSHQVFLVAGFCGNPS
jgi:hypothetical protein